MCVGDVLVVFYYWLGDDCIVQVLVGLVFCYNVFLLVNYGLVVIGLLLCEVINNIEELEEIVWLIFIFGNCEICYLIVDEVKELR